MDAWHIVDGLVGLVCLLLGVGLRVAWEDLKALTKTVADLNTLVQREYVRRDDYRDDISEIKGMLVRIFDRLDEKQDKP